MTADDAVEERKRDSATTLWRRESVQRARFFLVGESAKKNLAKEESYRGKRLPSVCSGLIFCFKASRRKKIWLSLESISQEGSHLSILVEEFSISRFSYLVLPMEMRRVDLLGSEIRRRKLGIVFDPSMDVTIYDPYLRFCGFINDYFFILIVDLKVSSRNRPKAPV